MSEGERGKVSNLRNPARIQPEDTDSFFSPMPEMQAQWGIVNPQFSGEGSAGFIDLNSSDPEISFQATEDVPDQLQSGTERQSRQERCTGTARNPQTSQGKKLAEM